MNAGPTEPGNVPGPRFSSPTDVRSPPATRVAVTTGMASALGQVKCSRTSDSIGPVSDFVARSTKCGRVDRRTARAYWRYVAHRHR